MAQLNQTFDASGVDPTPAYELLPAGDYLAMIVDSELKATKAGDGQYLNLTLQVIDGPYKDRLFFDRLNLVNSNAKAVEIAQRQLSQICHAVGVMRVNDSGELHDRPLVATVKIRKSPEYGDSNQVGSYKPAATGAAPAAAPRTVARAQTAAPKATPAQTAQAAHAASAGSPPPWARK
jgi:hypothetical protein